MPKVHIISATFTLRQKRDLMEVLLEKRRRVKAIEGRNLNMTDILQAIGDLPPHQGRWQRLCNTLTTLIWPNTSAP